MGLAELKDLASIASVMLSIGAMFYTFISSRQKNNARLFAALNTRIDEMEKRMTRAEAHLDNAPSGEDIHGIQLQMERMSGVLGRMEAVMEGNAQIMGRLESIVSRHEDHLLNNRN
jgi:hypothetical protein